MTCEIVGTRRVDMEGERGERISGYSVFLTHDEDGVMGVMAERCFVNDDWIRQHLNNVIPKAGDVCECSFNRRGKIVIETVVG